ncbi:glycosyltransferase family 2 protein [Variovorax sp. J31P179]|uniref:glycosyltransferase family 2 protein n=1 Tax=Variovorax sp. J31P179 TaxID=3053508 RepID=UPI002577F554|nr:glycosyltransferase family 2 protein [Variovorax sp. J31P179]MDM0081949.1 glycosyltransferase family 2 protein [Variovorax sp. J31P179]
MLGRSWLIFRRSGWRGLKTSVGILVRGEGPPRMADADTLDRKHYSEWVKRYDTPTDSLRAAMRERIASMGNTPLISVVMPVYDVDPSWLREAIESVRRQIYPHWELCIADDASPSEATRALLKEYAALDARIKVVFRPRNGHISAASNSALELAAGPWIALMDHDDLLAEHALFWLADAIDRHPNARLIYSDEDKIDGRGVRSAPNFKPDWNLDLFRSQNIFSHLGALRTDLVREVGGFRVGLEGAQDYDLVLRCIEHVAPAQVHHIPRVLYHWRVHAASTATSIEAKPYAQEAGARALNEHFARTGVRAKAECTRDGYRVHYELPDPPPLVSLIIPTRNAVELVRQCIESIQRKTTYPRYEIILVDNGSDDPAALDYFRQLGQQPGVRVIRDDRPFNYSALNNAAVESASGELVGLVNNDIEVISPDWLSEMVSIALQPGVGAVGARLWYPDMRLQHGGIILGIGGIAGHSHKRLQSGDAGHFQRAVVVQSLAAVTAACMVVRKDIYRSVGGLDEEHLQVAYNDVDFCLRVREAGYRNVWTPHAELIHHESATRGDDAAADKQARFVAEGQYMQRRWGEALAADPAYSPNLTLIFEDFSYAWPPRVPPLAPPTSLR